MTEHKASKLIIDKDDIVSSKRKFLKTMAYGSLLTLAGTDLAQATIGHFPSHKTLALQNTNTGDKLKLTYFENGRYIKGALQEISYILRDYHTGDMHHIDPALIDQLYDLKMLLGVSQHPIHIVSGYRSPHTNARLRQHSHGVAKDSLHMQGRAIDIRIAGVDTRNIRNAAISMRNGGVGYYPRSNFVHLETGDFRTW
ncbi:MAG: YcbK family protein [Methylococcales bacterium]